MTVNLRYPNWRTFTDELAPLDPPVRREVADEWIVADAAWQRLKIQADDRHVAAGHVEFVKDKYSGPHNRRTQTARSRETRRRTAQSSGPVFPSGNADDWRRGTEALASIPAETYLAILVPDSEPHRGKCRCPFPDHEDSNPSATYRDTVFYCHSQCARGGGIFTLGAALSGHRDHGPEFFDLRRWLADRLLGVAE